VYARQDAKEQFYAQGLKYFGISEELKVSEPLLRALGCVLHETLRHCYEALRHTTDVVAIFTLRHCYNYLKTLLTANILRHCYEALRHTTDVVVILWNFSRASGLRTALAYEALSPSI
jgi:hypothetical protein